MIGYNIIRYDAIGTKYFIHVVPEPCRTAPLPILETAQHNMKILKKMIRHDMWYNML
jgi:hypothetical protein